MTNLPWIPYVLLLVVAFAVGLVATVAASHVVSAPLSIQDGRGPALEQPAHSIPGPEALVPTLEC